MELRKPNTYTRSCKDTISKFLSTQQQQQQSENRYQKQQLLAKYNISAHKHIKITTNICTAKYCIQETRFRLFTRLVPVLFGTQQLVNFNLVHMITGYLSVAEQFPIKYNKPMRQTVTFSRHQRQYKEYCNTKGKLNLYCNQRYLSQTTGSSKLKIPPIRCKLPVHRTNTCFAVRTCSAP